MHLIGNHFTRLQRSTDFAALDVALGVGNPCAFLPPVPRRWAAIHDPLLVANWNERIREALREPVRVEQHRSGHRHVRVLGTAIFDIAPDGTMHCYRWCQQEDGIARLRAFPDVEVVAVGSPHNGLWMNQFSAGAMERLRGIHPPELYGACEQYVYWVGQQMLREHWHQAAAATAREQIAQALAFNPELRRLAAEMCRAQQPNLVRLSEYNYCLLHATRIARLEQEAPQLAFLHSMLYAELDPDMQATEAMAHYLEEHGVGRSVWRLLVANGSDWLQHFLSFYPISFGQPAALLDVLSVVQMFGSQYLIPDRMLHALMAVAGNPNRQRTDGSYAGALAGIEDLIARVGHLYREGGPDERRTLLEKGDAIFNWGMQEWATRPARSRRIIGIVGLLGAVRAHANVQALEHSSRLPWELPWTLASDDPQFEVRILRSALAVWEESQAMHHCVDKYIDRCEKGELLIASIRPVGDVRGRATVGFKYQKTGFVLQDLSGFANMKVRPEAVVIAKDCLCQLNSQLSHQGLQKAKDANVELCEAANDEQAPQSRGGTAQAAA